MLSLLSARRAPQELSRPLDTLPMQIGAWEGSDNPALDPAIEAVLNPSAYLSRTYRNGDREIDFFGAFYALQRAGETMHSPKNCLPGAGWEVWDYRTVEIPLAGGAVTVNEYSVQKGPQRMRVLYWYQTSDRVIASEYYAKACLVWDAVMRGRTSGSIVRVTLPDQPWALEAGIDFAARIIPLLQACLPNAQ